MKIGYAIKELRLRARISQKDLALNSKVTQGYISNVEHGKQQPTAKVLKRIAEALQVPPEIPVIMAMELKDTKPRLRTLYKQLKPAIDSFIDEYLNQVYGRTS